MSEHLILLSYALPRTTTRQQWYAIHHYARWRRRKLEQLLERKMYELIAFGRMEITDAEFHDL